MHVNFDQVWTRLKLNDDMKRKVWLLYAIAKFELIEKVNLPSAVD